MDPRNEQFIERMGQFCQNDAMPRIAGRMFGLLLLSPGPRSMDEIAELLQVSKASVSANARLLETIHMIGRVTKPGDRRDYYEVTKDTYERMIELRMERVAKMKELLEDGLATDAAETEPVRGRLVSFCRSFDTMLETM
ncbi:MAG: GbsR/MarR family transcriptional regulator, partial [Longimicrobiales bacterium]